MQLNQSAPDDLIPTGSACILKFDVRTSIRLSNKCHGILAFIALSMNFGFVPMRPRFAQLTGPDSDDHASCRSRFA
ncbi:MAG: hypothetical protein CBARDMAM_3980 [uncultured Caballeronia sp.]|nr:MAG: hypothetical protein CBARDMAM_3980 [uncultured Caballeronia sp.]